MPDCSWPRAFAGRAVCGRGVHWCPSHGRLPGRATRDAVVPREGGVSSAPRLINSITAASGILDRPPSRTMTTEYAFTFSRRELPEVCSNCCPRRNRGRREDRVHAAPAVSCAIAHRKRAHEHTGTGETLRPSLRNGFTAYNVLSPVGPGSLSPSPMRSFASHELDASIGASGPHDFAVRFRRLRLARPSRPPHLTARS